MGIFSVNFMDTIEKISESALSPDSDIGWQLIKVFAKILIPRTHCAVASINKTEIVIMGGQKKGEEIVSDAVIFNTTTEKCEKLASEDFFFTTLGNQCAQDS